MPSPPYLNFSFVLLGRIFENAVMLVLLVALAKSGKEVFGIYYLARAAASFVVELCELGLSRYTVRRMAGEADCFRSVFGAVVATRVALNGSGFLLSLAVLASLPSLEAPTFRTAVGLCGAYLLVSIADLFLDAMRAREEMGLPALLCALHKAVAVSGALLALRIGAGLDGVVIAILTAATFHLAQGAGLVAWRWGPPAIPRSGWVDRRLLSDARPFALRTLLAVVNGKVIFLLLYVYGDSAMWGEYGAVFFPVEALTVFAFAVSAAAFPRLTADFKIRSRLKTEGSAAAVKVLLTLALPIAAATTVLSPRIVPLLYGPEYAGTALLLGVGVWTVVPLFLNALLLSVLQAIGRARTAAMLLLPTVALNLVLGAVLVSHFGTAGAVSATLAVETSLMFLQLFALRRLMSLRRLFQGVGGLAASVAAMALAMILLRGYDAVVCAAAGATVYGLLRWRFYPLSDRDVIWLRSTLTQPRAGP